MRAIGVRIAGGSEGVPCAEADIERTLLEAVKEFPRDARLASLILSWLKVHREFVVVEKLKKLALQREKTEPGSTTWLGALAAFAVQERDHRWTPLLHRARERVYLVPKEVVESAVAMKGAVDWLAKYNYVVPVGSLRIREEDVLKPRELIPRNRQYRNRYRYGPSWRADIVSAMEEGAKTPTEIVRAVGCSYEPAYRVHRQLSLVTELGSYS
jgi:hypothetical protein